MEKFKPMAITYLKAEEVKSRLKIDFKSGSDMMGPLFIAENPANSEVNYRIRIRENSPEPSTELLLNEETGKIHVSHQESDRRHENITDHGGDDFSECSSDDDSHRHVEHISFYGKFFELTHHAHRAPSLCEPNQSRNRLGAYCFRLVSKLYPSVIR